MFLHIGGETVVLKKDIVAILDYKGSASNINKEFFDLCSYEEMICNVSKPGKEKSYLITSDKIYISMISCNTLKKRSKILYFDEE